MHVRVGVQSVPLQCVNTHSKSRHCAATGTKHILTYKHIMSVIQQSSPLVRVALRRLLNTYYVDSPSSDILLLTAPLFRLIDQIHGKLPDMRAQCQSKPLLIVGLIVSITYKSNQE